MKKIILLVIDGLGDENIPKLDNKTPLAAAQIPNMNNLAEEGICGEVIPFWFKKQHYPCSDSAHLALFGFNPKKEYLGRGPFEAMALDVDLEEGDLAFRINFATVKNGKIIDRRAGRIKDKEPFVEALQNIEIDGVNFIVESGIEHRGVLILKDKDRLSKEVTNSDPKETNVFPKKVEAKEETEKAKYTAKILNQFFEKASQILKDHPKNKEREEKGLLPANYILARGAGTFKKMESFEDKFNLKAGSITGGGVYKGVSKAVGMDIIAKGGKNKFGDDNLKEKFNLVADKIEGDYDFIFCHIKKIDNLSHDGDFKGKRDFLEEIDRKIKPLMLLKDTLVVITGDHSTSSLKKEHTIESLPVLIYDGEKDKVQNFSEKDCEKGKLGKIDQINLMEKIIEIAKS